MLLFKRSNGVYYCQYFDAIENRVKRLTTKTKLKNEALKFVTDLKEKLKKLPKLEPISLYQFRDEYVNYASLNFSRKQVENVQTSFKLLIEHIGNDKPLALVETKEIESFLFKVYQRAKYGASLYHRVLKPAFNKAIQWNYISENPLKKIKLPQIEKNFPLFISESELNLIIDRTEDRDLKDIFLFGFHTGCRLGEILNVQWKSIDLKNGVIKIINSETFKTKSKRERIIPINSTLLAMLKNRIPKVININKEQYLFQKFEGVRYLPDYVSKSFKKVVRQLGLNPKIHLHTLRHRFASNLVQRGVSLYVVKELLGHSDIGTTQIYSHLQHENLMQAVRTLDPKKLMQESSSVT